MKFQYKSPEHKKFFQDFKSHLKKRTKQRLEMKTETINDSSIMPSGLHKEKKLANVPAQYLLWLYENNKCTNELKSYIKQNLEILKQEK